MLLDAACGRDYETALHVACSRGCVELARMLLEAKANPSATDVLGRTPLLASCLADSPECAELLLAAGADIEKQNAAGELPTKIANVTLKMKMLKFKETGNFGLA